MKNKMPYRMGIGVSSVLIILVVISMTTLSVLGLLSARADLKLSEKRQEYVTQLQAAVSRYDEALFYLNEAGKGNISPDTAVLQNELMTQGVYLDRGVLYVPFYTDMVLTGRLAKAENNIAGRSFQIINQSEWNPDDGLSVYQGSIGDWTINDLIVLFEMNAQGKTSEESLAQFAQSVGDLTLKDLITLLNENIDRLTPDDLLNLFQ